MNLEVFLSTFLLVLSVITNSDGNSSLSISDKARKNFRGCLAYTNSSWSVERYENKTIELLDLIYSELPCAFLSTILDTEEENNEVHVDYYLSFDSFAKITDGLILELLKDGCPKFAMDFFVDCETTINKTSVAVSKCIPEVEKVCELQENDKCDVKNGTATCTCFFYQECDCNPPFGKCVVGNETCQLPLCQCSFGFTGSNCSNPLVFVMVLLSIVVGIALLSTIIYACRKSRKRNRTPHYDSRISISTQLTTLNRSSQERREEREELDRDMRLMMMQVKRRKSIHSNLYTKQQRVRNHQQQRRATIAGEFLSPIDMNSSHFEWSDDQESEASSNEYVEPNEVTSHIPFKRHSYPDWSSKHAKAIPSVRSPPRVSIIREVSFDHGIQNEDGAYVCLYNPPVRKKKTEKVIFDHGIQNEDGAYVCLYNAPIKRENN